MLATQLRIEQKRVEMLFDQLIEHRILWLVTLIGPLA
jgi:helix-turn-helix protein